MFDVFYTGNKPNLFAHERACESIEQAQQLSRTRYFWVVNYLTDYTGFDFLWEPVPWQDKYTHVWPSQWDQFYGAYLVPKHADTIQYHIHDCVLPAQPHPENFKTLIPCDFDYSWVPHPFDPPYIYVFGNQWYQAEKMPTVEYHAPGATERKFVHFPRAELLLDQTYWKVPEDIDTTDFDFSWRPDPGSPPYIYQFATQHQKTGGPQYVVPGATDVKYIDQIRARTSSKASAIIEIDHLDGNAGQIANTIKTSRYFDNYLDTLKRIAKTIPDEHEFVWICSSICDYTDFDFSWHPEQWQATMLHVFQSSGEKFGDTFFMHVPTFKHRSETCQLLDWYDLNFVDISVPRRCLPVIKHNLDSQADAIKQYTWQGPLAVFVAEGSTLNPDILPVVPLWRENTKTIVPCSPGAGVTVVPKSAVSYIKTQAYNYPYILKTKRQLYEDQPLDIVFISNGEVNADYNYEKLKFHAGDCNRIRRVDRVNGRVAAYHAAAEASTTPWFFAVFAKLEVNPEFDWTWQPDRLQQAKHYIFHARNPINGLEYGHQAMIAYNKELVLNNPGTGLDFTLDSAHEVVPILSGTAYYHNDPWMCWRTAFREALKLRAATDVESQYRLKHWLKPCEPSDDYDYAKWSHIGAQDAVEYYESVNGDFAELRKSYDWAWLSSYAFVKHNLTPDQ
jgi:hypothetical protein